MGRSQVERNRTHGRPGSRGRGKGRGRVGGSVGSDVPRRKKDLGDNSWRFNNSIKTEVVTDNTNFAIGGLSHIHPERDNLGSPENSSIEPSPLSSSLDVECLAKSLLNIAPSLRMNIQDPMVKELYDSNYGRRGRQSRDDNFIDTSITTKNEKSSKSVEEKNAAVDAGNAERSSTRKIISEVGNTDGKDEEEDLDAWLDSVIT